MVISHFLKDLRELILLLVQHRDYRFYGICTLYIAVLNQLLELLFCLIDEAEAIGLRLISNDTVHI